MHRGTIVPTLVITLAIAAFVVLEFFAVSSAMRTRMENINVAARTPELNLNVTVNTNTQVNTSVDSNETYVACGCGCCPGFPPIEQCLYQANGDSIAKVREADITASTSELCARAGCSIGKRYRYCDGETTNININTNTNINTNANTTVAVNVNTAGSTDSEVNTNISVQPAPLPEESKNPIKKVTDISGLFPAGPEEGFRRTNVMDDKALIAGGKYLYLYDGQTEMVTDLSDKIRAADPVVDAKQVVPGGIANNGKYWLIGNTRVGETVHLYQYDGQTWSDLTSQLLSAVPNTIIGGLNFAWNGSYWLIAHNPGHLVKYDGQTFTDLYSQIPNPEGNVTFMDIDWNGEYFMFIMLGPGNHGRVYRYDGTTFTRLMDVSTDSYVTTLSWNSTYWLVSGFNGQHLLKYDGQTFIDTGVGTRQQATTAWVKPAWLISGQLFDGEKLDPTPTVLAGFDISVGENWGIALNYKSVQRFDF